MLRYVCLSDLHAGADASLVTPLAGDTNQGNRNGLSSVTAAFVNAVHGFLDAYPEGVASNSDKALPQLVLLGDMLDLAFSDRGKASEIFGEFLSVFAGPNGAVNNAKKRFQDELIVIPGNHDHSLWTGSRYAYEASKIGSGDKEGGDGLLRATKAFSSTPDIQSPLIDGIAKHVGLKGTSDLRYPNFGTVSK
ncbi:MAG: metallophosphoesterase, partial [Pseudomonadota bacterium]